jgi:alpha-tubulin suppressor-like RCC1 family protein
MGGYGHTSTLKSDGSIWAWGNNNSGQLGDGTLIEKIAPVRIGKSLDCKILTAGYYHTLGVKQDGTLWA